MLRTHLKRSLFLLAFALLLGSGAAHALLQIGPVAKLTTAWHQAPDRATVPAGTTLEFRLRALPGRSVHWLGADEVVQRGSWSIATYRAVRRGKLLVGADILRPDGSLASAERCHLTVRDLDPEAIEISAIEISAPPLAIDPDNPNASTMDAFFGRSIAAVTRVTEGSFRTSVGKIVQLEVEVKPSSLAPLVEWRIGDEVYLGRSIGYRTPSRPGVQAIGVGPEARQRKGVLETYRVEITSHVSRRDVLPGGERVTLRAATTPPGFEDEITWLASTKFGSCEPLTARGRAFTVRFDDSWGLLSDGRPFQWLGVKADNAAFNQDQKPVITAGSDCWRTRCGTTRFSFCDLPLPAGFFAPGSAPFIGDVLLGGAGDGPFDTSIRRLGDLRVVPGFPDQTEIQLEELHLRSCQPIAVEVGDGVQQWDVEVGLSAAAVAPNGRILVSQTHPNGGVFNAEFSLFPVFTFTRVDDPNDVRVIDTGAIPGFSALELETSTNAPWVREVRPADIVQAPFTCDDDFAPGVWEDPSEDSDEQCCRPVGHAGPGHIHETGPPDCSSCPTGACCAPAAGPLAACTITNEPDCDALGGEYKGDGTECTDTDGDGLPNVMETHDCSVCEIRDSCNTGTDPNVADTDGDGVDDGVELLVGTDPCVPDQP